MFGMEISSDLVYHGYVIFILPEKTDKGAGRDGFKRKRRKRCQEQASLGIEQDKEGSGSIRKVFG